MGECGRACDKTPRWLHREGPLTRNVCIGSLPALMLPLQVTCQRIPVHNELASSLFGRTLL